MKVEEIKKKGAEDGLKQQIRNLIHHIGYRNFEGIMGNQHYIKLGEAISNARCILDELEECLTALNESDKKSK